MVLFQQISGNGKSVSSAPTKRMSIVSCLNVSFRVKARLRGQVIVKLLFVV